MSATGRVAAAPDTPGAPLQYLLRLGDTSLVLAQRLGEWIGHAPAIEEDLGLANTALDLLGQARLLLAYAGEIEGRGRSEDDLAFLREESEFRNATLAEMPNGHFGDTIVRQWLLDAFQVPLYEHLAVSRDPRLAEIAAKALKESRYHLRYSAGWVVRLGDGTEESHARMQASVERLWPYTLELFDPDEIDRAVLASGVGPDLSALQREWSGQVDTVLADATLGRPAAPRYRWYGKQGRHSEHLGPLLAEMQHLPRVHPGARW